MRPFFETDFGNAASNSHAYGWRAQAAVEKARASVARLIGARSDEIIFTSGATESNNWAILSNLSPGDHLITTAIEHKSVLCVAEHLQTRGVAVTYLMPTDDIAKAVTRRTKMISIMMANNEIGSILPVAEMGQIAKSESVLFHCDAVQAAGKIKIDVNALGVDFLSLSAHKMYGPKGIGALFVRRGLAMKPLMFGAQEQGMRGGTLNVPGIVGFGAAADIAMIEAANENKRVLALRNRLLNTLSQAIPNMHINGSLDDRLPGNLNISITGIDGELMLLAVQNKVALSIGAACSSSDSKGSHVLKAIGVPPERIQSSFRIGIGRFNTEEEIDRAAHALVLAHAQAKC